MSDDDLLSTAEVDQMSKYGEDLANHVLTHFINARLARVFGVETEEDAQLQHAVDALKPLDTYQMAIVIWEIAHRLIDAMVEKIGGDITQIRGYMEQNLLFGMTTSDEVAHRDLPKL